MEYAETLLLPSFAAYTNAPEGSTAIPSVFVPAPNGDPATCVSTPLVPSIV
jgi:hypothetical protein